MPPLNHIRTSWTVPRLLLGLYIIEFIICAIAPYDRAVWWAENIPVLLVVGILVGTAHMQRFSNTAYLLMAVFIFLHTIGGHYTFERVPFSFVTELFGFERNHFDRLAHFSVGFYAYAIAELLLTRRLVNSRWILALFPLFAITTLAGFYEIFEWQYAVHSDPKAGIAVLGSQGDIWDAQEDILADTLGAVLMVMLFFYQQRRELSELGRQPARTVD